MFISALRPVNFKNNYFQSNQSKRVIPPAVPSTRDAVCFRGLPEAELVAIAKTAKRKANTFIEEIMTNHEVEDWIRQFGKSVDAGAEIKLNDEMKYVFSIIPEGFSIVKTTPDGITKIVGGALIEVTPDLELGAVKNVKIPINDNIHASFQYGQISIYDGYKRTISDAPVKVFDDSEAPITARPE